MVRNTLLQFSCVLRPFGQEFNKFWPTGPKYNVKPKSSKTRFWRSFSAGFFCWRRAAAQKQMFFPVVRSTLLQFPCVLRPFGQEFHNFWPTGGRWALAPRFAFSCCAKTRSMIRFHDLEFPMVDLSLGSFWRLLLFSLCGGCACFVSTVCIGLVRSVMKVFVPSHIICVVNFNSSNIMK